MNKSKFMEDQTLAFLYNTTVEIGQETFDGFPNLSIVACKAIDPFYIDSTREVQVFRELGETTRKAYLDIMCKFMVYLLTISHHEHHGSKEPALRESLKGKLQVLRAKIVTAMKATVVDEGVKDVIKIQILEILDTALLYKLDTIFEAGTNSSFNNPAITFFIILCVDRTQYVGQEETKGAVLFKSTSFIQNILSKMIYVSRLCNLAFLNHLTKENALENPDEFIEQRFTTNSRNYVTEFHSLRVKLRYHNESLISAYKSIRVFDWNTVLVNKMDVKIPTLKRVFTNSLAKLEDLFFKGIMFFTEKKADRIVHINLQSIDDDKDSQTPLADMSTVSNLGNLKTTLIKRSKDLTTSLGAFLTDGKVVNQLEVYLKRVSEFLQLLAINIFLLSTSPLRGQALTLMKFRNTTLGTLRNLFLGQTLGQIAIDTTNLSKGRDTRLQSFANIRFLPLHLSNIIVHLHWNVLPLVGSISPLPISTRQNFPPGSWKLHVAGKSHRCR